MSVSYGDIFYGVFWRIESNAVEEAEKILRDALQADDDKDLNDMLDDLSETHGAHVVIHTDGDVKVRTVYFGHTISSVSESENKFDEMALLRSLDLEKGVLREDIKDSVKKKLEEIPYNLREHLTGPGFNMAWGRA